MVNSWWARAPLCPQGAQRRHAPGPSGSTPCRADRAATTGGCWLSTRRPARCPPKRTAQAP
eukprot:1644335-Alexandrium_andersonii.AAC.1